MGDGEGEDGEGEGEKGGKVHLTMCSLPLCCPLLPLAEVGGVQRFDFVP